VIAGARSVASVVDLTPFFGPGPMMKNFNFIKATTLDDAIFVLQKHGPKARVLAGGTDLVVDMKLNRQNSPDHIVSLRGLADLNYLRKEKDGLAIGAMTPLKCKTLNYKTLYTLYYTPRR